MLIKITPALLAAAVLLPGACTAFQCSFQSLKANIVEVNAFSAQDLATSLNRNMQSGGWAAVTLTQNYFESVDTAETAITLRHTGADCRRVVGEASSPACNRDNIQQLLDNTCADVSHSDPEYGQRGTSVAFAAAESKEDVHFRAHFHDLLKMWKIRVPGTCAHRAFKAPREGMKVLTFSANNTHKWSKVVVELDKEDHNFGQSWLCDFDDNLDSQRPQISTEDGKTFTVVNVSFDDKVEASSESAWESASSVP